MHVYSLELFSSVTGLSAVLFMLIYASLLFLCIASLLEQEVYFTKQLESLECFEKETVQLSCAVSKSKAKVTWYKDGVEITSGVHYKINGPNGTRTLTILNTQIADTSEYSCTISCSKATTQGSVLVKGSLTSLV